jgi:hypothetical protein
VSPADSFAAALKSDVKSAAEAFKRRRSFATISFRD